MPASTIRLFLCAALLLVLGGCDAADTPAARAQSFWDTVAAGRHDAALDLVVPGERQRQRGWLEELTIQRADVTPLDVPAEIEVAYLPTTVVREAARDSGDEGWRYEMLTVLRRLDDGWYVDLAETRVRYRAAAVEAVGERLGERAEELGNELGRHAGELAASIEALAERLRRDLEGGSERLTDDLADDVARALEHAGTRLEEAMERLRETLEAPAQEGEQPAPGDDRPE